MDFPPVWRWGARLRGRSRFSLPLLSVGLSVCLSICVSVHPSVRPLVRPSICRLVRLSFCPSVRPSVCLSIRPQTRDPPLPSPALPGTIGWNSSTQLRPVANTFYGDNYSWFFFYESAQLKNKCGPSGAPRPRGSAQKASSDSTGQRPPPQAHTFHFFFFLMGVSLCGLTGATVTSGDLRLLDREVQPGSEDVHPET